MGRPPGALEAGEEGALEAQLTEICSDVVGFGATEGGLLGCENCQEELDENTVSECADWTHSVVIDERRITFALVSGSFQFMVDMLSDRCCLDRLE